MREEVALKINLPESRVQVSPTPETPPHIYPTQHAEVQPPRGVRLHFTESGSIVCLNDDVTSRVAAVEVSIVSVNEKKTRFTNE